MAGERIAVPHAGPRPGRLSVAGILRPPKTPEPGRAVSPDIRDRCTSDFLSSLTPDKGLGALSRYAPESPERQLASLLRVPGVPHGRVLAAVKDGRLVGYLTLHAPDPSSRWADLPAGHILELGGIEVARGQRRCGLARRLLDQAFSSPDLDAVIVYAQALTWCWDLRETGLRKAEYRHLLLRLFRAAGFDVCPTDEGNIRHDRANLLLVRAGPGVPAPLMQAFRARLIHKAEEW